MQLCKSRLLNNRARDCAGIVIPIAGALIALIGGVIVLFMADTYLVSRAQAQLGAAIEELCVNGVVKLPITQNSVQSVANKVKGLDLEPGGAINLAKGVTLTELNILSPNISDGTLSSIPLSTLLSPSTCPASICKYGGDVEDVQIAKRFPTGFWDNQAHGQFISCEAKAEVSTLLSGTREVYAKTAYSVKTKNSPGPSGQARGVVIGIAPQYEIFHHSDSRFSFPAAYSSLNPADTSVKAFNWDRVAADTFSGMLLANSVELDNGTTKNNARKRCFNPYSFSRNPLISSVFAQLARLEPIRTQMQVAILNAVRPLLSEENPPTMMLQYGQDALARNYTMPFVRFRKPIGGLEQCPFSWCGTDSAAVDKSDRFDMLQASQLRDCMSVANSANGISLPHDSTIQNDAYEPLTITAGEQLPLIYDALEHDDWGPGNSSEFVIEELLRIIPNVEECPVKYSASTGVASSTTPNSCTSWNDPADLKSAIDGGSYIGIEPDVVSFLKFAIIGTNANLAYPSPGPLLKQGGGDLFPAIQNQEGDDPESHIILFLSKPLTAQQLTQITPIVAALDPMRKLIVVYMPTHSQDSTFAYLQTLRAAFNIDQISHILIVLSPCKGEPGEDVKCGNVTKDDAIYRDYWLETVNPAKVAKTIVRSLLETRVAL